VIKDALGDPLPSGAILRLGSSRLFSGGGPGSTCRFSADGSLLAWAGPHRFTCLYRVKDGKALLTIDRGAEAPKAPTILVPLAEISPDGKYLATQSRGEDAVFLWDVTTGKKGAKLAVPQQTTVLAFSRDGKQLAAGNDQGQVHVYEVPSGKEIAVLKNG